MGVVMRVYSEQLAYALVHSLPQLPHTCALSICSPLEPQYSILSYLSSLPYYVFSTGGLLQWNLRTMGSSYQWPESKLVLSKLEVYFIDASDKRVLSKQQRHKRSALLVKQMNQVSQPLFASLAITLLPIGLNLFYARLLQSSGLMFCNFVKI